MHKLPHDCGTVTITVHVGPMAQPYLRLKPQHVDELVPLALALNSGYFVYAFVVDEILVYSFAMVFSGLTVGTLVFLSYFADFIPVAKWTRSLRIARRFLQHELKCKKQVLSALAPHSLRCQSVFIIYIKIPLDVTIFSLVVPNLGRT